jgi:hypothetical protein
MAPRRTSVGEPMSVRRTTLGSCLVAAALLPACVHRQAAFEAASLGLPTEPVVLEVENHNWADIVLYVVHDGIQTRFAQVAAAHNVSMEIPTKLQGQMGVIRIAARRIGGTDSYLSQPISLRGGSAVRFTIESSLSRSSVGVW